MAAHPRTSGLTRRQKRLIVLGRLASLDAAAMSDRAIARELGVSQPFVSALRRDHSHGRAPNGATPPTSQDNPGCSEADRKGKDVAHSLEDLAEIRHVACNLNERPMFRWVPHNERVLEACGRARSEFDPYD